MVEAKPILNAIPVINTWKIGAEYGFETTCNSYEAYAALPCAAELDGRQYVLTGWNSDTGRACYKTGRPMAKGKG